MSEPMIQRAAPGPDITVYGLGGAGTNIATKLFKEVPDTFTLKLFDTSIANASKNPDVVIVANGSGSGGVRGTNSRAIIENLAGMSADDLGMSSLNILIASGSGGSGGVLLTSLLKELHRRGGQCVVALVADMGSHDEAENVIKTLQSLNLTSTNNKIYVPTMVVSNTVGRNVADTTIVHRLTQLLVLETAPAHEIDRNDRLFWLKGPDGTYGIRILKVVAGVNPDDDAGSGEMSNYSNYYDSVMMIATQDDDGNRLNVKLPDNVKIRRRYTGAFMQPRYVPITGLVSGDDNAIEPLVKEILDIQNNFKSIKPVQGSAVIPMSDYAEDDMIV